MEPQTAAVRWRHDGFRQNRVTVFICCVWVGGRGGTSRRDGGPLASGGSAAGDCLSPRSPEELLSQLRAWFQMDVMTPEGHLCRGFHAKQRLGKVHVGRTGGFCEKGPGMSSLLRHCETIRPTV